MIPLEITGPWTRAPQEAQLMTGYITVAVVVLTLIVAKYVLASIYKQDSD
jgi:hypothetical protein